MATFKRLTTSDLTNLTRAELLDRIEAEQQYWERKQRRGMTDEDRAALQQFREIMHASFDLSDAIADTTRLVTDGRGAAGTYWDEVPGKVIRLRHDGDRS